MTTQLQFIIIIISTGLYLHLVSGARTTGAVPPPAPKRLTRQARGEMYLFAFPPYVGNLPDYKQSLNKAKSVSSFVFTRSKINLNLARLMHLSFPHRAVAYL